MIGLYSANSQSGVGFTGLLDEYEGAAAAYSVRLLRSAYSGALVEIRESGGNTVKSFLPDSNNELSLSSVAVSDGETLSDFVGVNDGFVRTWYDQSGNAKDLIQFTSSNQPKIISSGAFEVIGVKPSILGLDNSLLTVPSSTAYFKFLHDGTKSFVSNVIKTPSNLSNLEFIWLTNQTGSSDVGADLLSNAGNYRQFTRNGTITQRNENTWVATANSHETLSLIFDAGNATAADRLIARINGGSDLANNTRTFAPSTANSTNDLNVFNYFDPTRNFGFTGKYQELIFWDNDQSSNREGIETNQNTYYSIY